MCHIRRSDDYIAVRSLRLDVGRLDYRPPFLDLRLLLGGERPWRLLLARPSPFADFSKASAHCGVGQSFDQRSIELGDDILGRALRSPQAVPERVVQPRHARLIKCRRLW